MVFYISDMFLLSSSKRSSSFANVRPQAVRARYIVYDVDTLFRWNLMFRGIGKILCKVFKGLVVTLIFCFCNTLRRILQK